MPQGLLESIGQSVQHKDQFGVKLQQQQQQQSNVYLPPPTNEIPPPPTGLFLQNLLLFFHFVFHSHFTRENNKNFHFE